MVGRPREDKTHKTRAIALKLAKGAYQPTVEREFGAHLSTVRRTLREIRTELVGAEGHGRMPRKRVRYRSRAFRLNVILFHKGMLECDRTSGAPQTPQHRTVRFSAPCSSLETGLSSNHRRIQ